MKKLKAILAGSTGFLGSALQRGLKNQYDLAPLKRDRQTGEGDLAGSRLPGLPKADVLFHAAGLTLGRVNPDEMAQVYSTNIQITLNLLSLCRKAGIPKIIFASSYVYGHPASVPIREDHPVQAITPYMHSKILCEEILKAYSQWAGIHAVCLRLFNIYGPAQRLGLLIPDILAQIRQPEIALGDPRPKRDFIYIDDVVVAFDKAARAEIRGWEAINIASGQSVSVEQIAQQVVEVAGSNARLRFHQSARPVEIGNVVADISKAKRLLGWTPTVTLEEGLRRVATSRPDALKEHARL